jgi:hypothetical protein
MTLTPYEAGQGLAILARVDNRHWDETTATVWANTINPDVTTVEYAAAIQKHLATSTEWATPAHINALVAGVRAERRQRIKDAGPPDFPDDLTYQQEQAYRLAYHQLIGDGKTREEAHASLDRAGHYTRRAIGPAPDGFRKQIESAFRPVSRRFTNWGKWQVRGQDLVFGSNRFRIPLAEFGDLDHWVRRVETLGLGKADVIADLKAAHLDLIGEAA